MNLAEPSMDWQLMHWLLLQILRRQVQWRYMYHSVRCLQGAAREHLSTSKTLLGFVISASNRADCYTLDAGMLR